MLLSFKDLKPFAKVSITMMRIFQLKCFHWEGERKKEKNIPFSWKLKILLFLMQARNNTLCGGKKKRKEEIAMKMLMVF